MAFFFINENEQITGTVFISDLKGLTRGNEYPDNSVSPYLCCYEGV